MTTRKARRVTTTGVATRAERTAWAHDHRDQIIGVMRALVQDDPDDLTGQGAMYYFGNPHPHYGEGSDCLAEDCAYQMTSPDSPFYAPDAPRNLYDDGCAPDPFYDFAIELARESDPDYIAPHNPDMPHPDPDATLVARVIASIDPDVLSALRAAETKPLDYALSYESPRDPTLEVVFNVTSQRLPRRGKSQR